MTKTSQRSNHQQQPIGVFDSGVGGLTVVAALQRLLPHEDIIYLGDTARVPYGGKSQETVIRYSREIIELLLKRQSKMIVVACNTASALALPLLKKEYSTSLQGVIDPGASAAVAVTPQGTIGVIGTKSTIASKAYRNAIHAKNTSFQVVESACPLLVPLIEEGFFEDNITEMTLHRYLDPMLEQNIDTLVLGCTHYPLLKPAIQKVVGSQVSLVDSAENCALAVQSFLTSQQLTNPSSLEGNLEIMLTDTSEGFLHLAAKTLSLNIGSLKTVTL